MFVYVLYTASSLAWVASIAAICDPVRPTWIFLIDHELMGSMNAMGVGCCRWLL